MHARATPEQTSSDDSQDAPHRRHKKYQYAEANLAMSRKPQLWKSIKPHPQYWELASGTLSCILHHVFLDCNGNGQPLFQLPHTIYR
jgi:hypothetical protein